MKATDDLEHADPLEPLEELFRDLRASAAGLSGREAARRLEVSGPNELVRRGGRRCPASWPGSSPIRWRCCWRRPPGWPGPAARPG